MIAQLLAKEPADRFPNTPVLARHLQAMMMALTRPTHDGFSLAGDPNDLRSIAPDLHSDLALAVTRLEPELPAAKTIQPLLSDVAANEGGAAPLAINVAETMPADEADGSKSPSPQPSIAAVAAAQVVPTTPGHAVFTTVEEDVAAASSSQRDRGRWSPARW